MCTFSAHHIVIISHDYKGKYYEKNHTHFDITV